jgi:hypothetical protein
MPRHLDQFGALADHGVVRRRQNLGSPQNPPTAQRLLQFATRNLAFGTPISKARAVVGLFVVRACR